MDNLFQHYEQKLAESGIAETGATLMGVLDADLEWNRMDPLCKKLTPLFDCLTINSLLLIVPAEPYRSIIRFLAETSHGPIQPQDCETRTFLHDIPVCRDLNPAAISSCLQIRKGVVTPDYGIVTHGSVSIEQAFVSCSSICFASFVKFFSDYLSLAASGGLTGPHRRLFEKVWGLIDPMPEMDSTLLEGPFQTEFEVRTAMMEAGSATVKKRLVDSYFGNISYCCDEVLYISQTGSSLDDLEHCIDPCPLDESSCASMTASSELPAHFEVIKQTGARAILHGHPKFAVILSMDCRIADCPIKGECYRKCDRDRSVCGVPIVPGEVGSGPYGLCNTIPKALTGKSGVIVYGHGVFTSGDTDFNDPFRRLLEIENGCRREYLKRVEE